MGTIQIHEMTADATGFDKTSNTVRFKEANDTAYDDNDRLQILSSGENFSFTKHLRAYVSAAPSVDFTNLECYTDGGSFSDGAVKVEFDVQQTFQTQTDVDIAGTDLFTLTDGAKQDMDANDTEHTDGDGTGYWGDHLRLQMVVQDTASPGTLTAEDLTFSYDET